MATAKPGFEYDIFISYRHNDNHSGWVTDFVRNLQVEMSATLKDPISIYFDSNPYDGLLETHNVDKSLEGKLKSLIFIPILSQTYCDPKSFAWKQEFCVFNRLAQEDLYGRDIKLNNGNVASRILPIKIHSLETDDKTLIEKEIGGGLRAIEFIFRSPGVNRPLGSNEDNPGDNQNKTFYRDQINKTANAIKEIINAIKYPGRKSNSMESIWDSTSEPKKKVADTASESISERSIAVLPFANLSQDPGQEYFADGITENILIQLAGLPQFRVISRTSIMRFKNTTKLAKEIATELSVKFIVEGSAQTHKEKVRISVQLIDAEKDQHLWSKIFVESMDDIFEIQNSVAETVAKELNTSINPVVNKKKKEAPTKNLEAYDLFLKGRHAFNQWGVEGYRTATEYFNKAIELDPDFRDAYSFLASSYSARMSWNGDLSPNEARVSIDKYLTEAWNRGPSENDYLTKAFVEFFIEKNFASAENYLKQAIELGPNNSNLMYTYSYLLNMSGRFKEALQWVNKAKEIDPLTIAFFNYQTITLHLAGQSEQALSVLKEGLRLYPSVLRFYDFLGRIHLTLQKFEEAEKAVLTGFKTTSIRPPSMVAYLACAYLGQNKIEKAEELLNELIERSGANEKGVNLYVAHIYNVKGELDNAMVWVEKARATNDVDLIWWNVDPLVKNLGAISTDRKNSVPDFEVAEEFILEMLEKEMPNLPYHNVEHIKDVVDVSMQIAKDENLSGEEIKILRIAALLHDAGFIRSPKDHESHGVDIAGEILPGFGFQTETVEIIGNMIMATRIPQSPSTQLERVLCDADLDYLGREDFEEVGRGLYQELKEQGVVETEREWNLVQKTFIESHRYHTNYGKTKRESSKQEHIKEVIDNLKSK